MEIKLHANLRNDNRSDSDTATTSETKPKDQELMRFLSLARMLIISVESNYKKGKWEISYDDDEKWRRSSCVRGGLNDIVFFLISSFRLTSRQSSGHPIVINIFVYRMKQVLWEFLFFLNFFFISFDSIAVDWCSVVLCSAINYTEM